MRIFRSTAIARLLAYGVLFGGAGTASAVGDLPERLGMREATAYYATIRSLLVNDGKTCPVGQTPTGGVITGGAAPTAGSRSVVITFDKGAVVKVVSSWVGKPGEKPSATVNISCS